MSQVNNIQPGASLLVAWQVKGKRVLVVGGGEVAAQRLFAVLNANAQVTLVAMSPLHPNILPLLPLINFYDRAFIRSDLDTLPDLVLTAISDPHESRSISALCRERRIPINVADDPSACDFYFGSVIRRGPLQILISTNGNGPRIAHLVKEHIEDALPKNIGQVIDNVGSLRRKLRQRTRDISDVGSRRMKWISQICDTWSFQDLASLDEKDMSRLLDEGWEQGIVPHPKHNVHHGENQSYRFKAFSNYVLFGSGFTFAVGFLSGVLMTTVFKHALLKRTSTIL